jgi:hypothetical protein
MSPHVLLHSLSSFHSHIKCPTSTARTATARVQVEALEHGASGLPKNAPLRRVIKLQQNVASGRDRVVQVRNEAHTIHTRVTL